MMVIATSFQLVQRACCATLSHSCSVTVKAVSAGGPRSSRKGGGAPPECQKPKAAIKAHRMSVPAPSFEVVQSTLLGHSQPHKLLGWGAVRVAEDLLHHRERIGLHIVGCRGVCPAQLHKHGLLASFGPQLLLSGDDQLDLAVGKLEGVLEICLKHLLTLQTGHRSREALAEGDDECTSGWM